MEQTNYRILKLKNGESLIAGIMPVTKKDVITLENPMTFKTVSMIDEKNLGMREFLVIRNWNEYSLDETVEIAADNILAIMTPDDKITTVYNFEKQKRSMTNLEQIEDAINQVQDKIKEDKENIQFHTVNLELKLSPEASMDLMDLLGIDITEEMEEDLEDDVDDMNDQDIDDILEEEEQEMAFPVKKPKLPPENKKPTWGNSFEDWSPDPNDYLK